MFDGIDIGRYSGIKAYTLMNKNTPVLECSIEAHRAFIKEVGKIVNPEYLPVGVGVNKSMIRDDLNSWIQGRAIPASRVGIQDVLDTLGLPGQETLLLASLGLSLSDQYWLNPEGALVWGDINYFTNAFSEDVGDILFGSPAKDGRIDLFSPDNTSDGWLKKRWKIIDGKRCLLKGGSGTVQQEPINEAFVSRLLGRLDVVEHVGYDLVIIDERAYSVCANFITEDTELVTAWQIMNTEKRPNHVSRYEHFLGRCAALGIPGAREYMDVMLSLDYLILNSDRHYRNFGAIRDVNTLQYIGMAPVYDSGTSLWSDTFELMISADSTYSAKPFYSDPLEQLKLVSSFMSFDVSRLKGSEEDFEELLLKAPTISQERRERLCGAYQKRLEGFERLIKERTDKPV